MLFQNQETKIQLELRAMSFRRMVERLAVMTGTGW